MVEKITATNMAQLVAETFAKCLYKEGEDTTGMIAVEGIAHNYGFHPERLQEQKEIIQALVAELPVQFKEGWTFLNLCTTKDGEQWTGLHLSMEQLMVMAIGLDIMAYCMPREMWNILPGGVPYVIVK